MGHRKKIELFLNHVIPARFGDTHSHQDYL